MPLRRVRCGALFATLCAAAWACAQEPINAADSATQPSPGHFIIKEQFRFYALDVEGPRDRRGEARDAVLFSTLNVGVRPDVSLSFRFPAALRERELAGEDSVSREAGAADLTALAKWRVVRHDTGALDTIRASLIAGSEFRTGQPPFSSEGFNPILGAAYTQIAGRHGLNASLQWVFATGGAAEPLLAGESTADVLRYDLAYLFRLSPEQYTADTHGALYGVCELNGVYETNGDQELFVAPGVMYEARTWTAELSVQAPVWRTVDHRATKEYAVIAGVRFSW